MTEHRPAPLDTERHHIWPLGDGGPDVEENQIDICDTTHKNAHIMMAAMKREHRDISWYEFAERYTMPVSKYAYFLARTGYLSFRESRVIGHPHSLANLEAAEHAE
jgi:hypothetical protein